MATSIKSFTTLVAIAKATVTAESKTLAALGITLNPGLKRLVLLPDGIVNWAIDGAASAATAALPVAGIDFPMDAGNGALLEFYAANVTMAVLQFA